MRTELEAFASEFDALAHKADQKSDAAYSDSDYEMGNYHRGLRDAFLYAAARLRESAPADSHGLGS